MIGHRLSRAAAGLALAGALIVGTAAQAQFSGSYKFLEAVRKADGAEVTEALSEPGSTVVNTRDLSTGDTALHIVTARRDLVWIKFLLQHGANVNARNNKGETPLQAASNIGFVDGVELLLSLGARVDEANSTGETPLISAVHRKDAAMARVLLKAGADYKRSDNSGRTALDYAQLDGRSNPVLGEIETAMRAPVKKAAPVYGPKL
ncbi:ankyrin repeat domain-containing protein [Novosphingobium tardum]|uniref:Ankyrin repeat domain-containing protein n=1 Tax=Novosphingobium tardum TaxID=1538021 RepID=A0ABV8RPE2_9SPHN